MVSFETLSTASLTIGAWTLTLGMGAPALANTALPTPPSAPLPPQTTAVNDDLAKPAIQKPSQRFEHFQYEQAHREQVLQAQREQAEQAELLRARLEQARLEQALLYRTPRQADPAQVAFSPASEVQTPETYTSETYTPGSYTPGSYTLEAAAPSQAAFPLSTTAAGAAPPLPADGTYLYGQRPTPDQLATAYFVFEALSGEVAGAFFMPSSSFDCVQGQMNEQSIVLNVTDSYTQESYSYALSLDMPSSDIAQQQGYVNLPPNISGFYSLPVRDSDREILATCQANII